MKISELIKREKKQWQLYLLILLPLVQIIIFKYVPMYGIQIAFKDFIATKGIMGSPWAGLAYFNRFFNSFYFSRLMVNTLSISIIGLIISFPIPIIFAIALNEVKNNYFKKVVQTVTYAPYFISTVVLVGIILQFFDPRVGIVNNLIKSLGFQPIHFMGEPKLFLPMYIGSAIWQATGYSAVIYLAALSSIDPEIYEAAIIDGASKLQKIRHIDIPGIAPTIIVLLILAVGNTMNVGFEKVYLMQNPLNLEKSEVISTYVYKMGLNEAQYSFASAVGLFNSIINFILLVATNKIARNLNQTALW